MLVHYILPDRAQRVYVGEAGAVPRVGDSVYLRISSDPFEWNKQTHYRVRQVDWFVSETSSDVGANQYAEIHLEIAGVKYVKNPAFGEEK